MWCTVHNWPRSTGYLKYGPLVQELAGIPHEDFLHPIIKKLADWCRRKDVMPDEFKRRVDDRRQGRVTHSSFKQTIGSLRNDDLDVNSAEIDELFKYLLKKDSKE